MQHQCKDTLHHASMIIRAVLQMFSKDSNSFSPFSSSSSSSTHIEDDTCSSASSSSPASSTSDKDSSSADNNPLRPPIAPQSMNSLSLARKGLHNVPIELSDVGDHALSYLSSLDLSSNILSYFPFLVAHYKQLEVLNLSDNEFREIPELLAESFAKLTRLRVLNVSHNKIYRLPSQLSLLTNLEQLEASHNRLLYHEQQEIEPIREEEDSSTAQRCTLASFNFASLAASLEHLSVSFNSRSSKARDSAHSQNKGSGYTGLGTTTPEQLHHFPRSLLELTKLTTLKFQGNNIPHLPSNFFAKFSSLKELDIGSNSITQLPPGLGGLPLTSLNMNSIELRGLIPADLYQVSYATEKKRSETLTLHHS